MALNLSSSGAQELRQGPERNGSLLLPSGLLLQCQGKVLSPLFQVCVVLCILQSLSKRSSEALMKEGKAKL